MSKCIIIAEVGVNHNGSIELAKKHIDAAKTAGVDYVKFQTFKTEKLVTKKGSKANYQKLNNSDSETQFEMLKKLELSERDFLELNTYCLNNQIGFLSTGFDLESLDFLNEEINQEIFKIPSGEITNFPYLRKVASFGKPVILSTGMCIIPDIEKAVNVLTNYGCKREQITILHCNTAYPTPLEDVDLNAMNHIKKELRLKVGYSDHTEGVVVSIAAVSLGATVIEKHFTFDKQASGPDHKASLSFDELNDLVRAIRNVEKALSGDGIKKITKSESANIKIARKGIYLLRNKSQGESISETDITTLRPLDENGICAMEWDNIIGKQLIKNVSAFEPLTFNDLNFNFKT